MDVLDKKYSNNIVSMVTFRKNNQFELYKLSILVFKLFLISLSSLDIKYPSRIE